MFKKMDLWSKTVFRVFSALAEKPLENYHVRKISKMADVSVGSASNSLRVLYNHDFVTKNVVGRQTFYRINLDNPVSCQFKVLMNILSLSDIIEELKPYAERIILFGSASKGMNTPDSDFDLFIESENPMNIKEVLRKYRNISPVIVEIGKLQEFKTGNKALYENVKTGILLWRETHGL
ncbi:MAG: nucleotidyltransferase domain-containing protein [Thermoplasmatales archaeon]|nr:nucleotidyltransferase domain-containing protein [Thermoplasmatales archaeon]